MIKEELGISGNIEIHDKNPEPTLQKQQPIKTLDGLRDGTALYVKQVLFSIDQWSDLTKQASNSLQNLSSNQGQKLIEENMAHAYEHHPETMLHEAINMLYIKVYIEQSPVIAFIDTGAQMSILTMAAVRRCR